MKNKSIIAAVFNGFVKLSVAVLLLTCFGITVFAGDVETENGWSYTTDGFVLYAKNSETGENASVALNPSGSFVKNRTGISMMCECFVSENNWREQENIDDFYLLYEGKTSENNNYSAFVPPTESGNYTVRLVVFSTPYDTESDYISTDAIPFYQTSSSDGKYTITEHTEEEQTAAKDTIKKSSDGYYQVITLDDFLYATFYGGSDAKIELLNDIVYNPITVSADNSCVCAGTMIYNWNPIGTEDTPFTGTIKGNGHTIYGLYNATGKDYCGLIGYGRGCSVVDLTLSDCYFEGNTRQGSVGAFAGELLFTSSDGHEIIFNNLSAVSCYLSGYCTGGIIGECRTVEDGDIYVNEETYTNKRNYLTVSDCISDSVIISSNYSGGIIGRLYGGTVVTIEYCLNNEIIKSDYTAGGIIGEADCVYQRLYLKNCVSKANVAGGQNAGGIIGTLNLENITKTDIDKLKLLFSDPFANRLSNTDRYYGDTRIECCYFYGELSSKGWYEGGIIGNAYPTNLNPAYGSSCMISCGSVNDSALGNIDCDELFYSYSDTEKSWEQLDEETILKNINKKIGHFSEAFYEITFDSDLLKTTRHCLVCGNETECNSVNSHEHLNYDGVCEYCGEELSQCSKHSLIYFVYGNKINACCTECHHTESVWIDIEGDLTHTAEEKEFCLCEGTPEISIEKTDGWNSSYPLVRLVYKNPNGTLTYNTMPSEAEDFGSVYLEVYTGKRKVTSLSVTSPITLDVCWHHWEYSSEDYSLYADCSSCKAHASVTLNQDGAYTANLNAEENTFSDIDYEIFIDNGWLSQKGIENYYVLYDGLSAKENYKQGIKYKAFKRPDGPGNYKACLAMVLNPLDPDTAYLQTESISYYIATIPISECEVKDYSLAQLKSYTLPEKKDGYYQVGSLEDLLAVIYYTGIGYNADIELTADIVANPISVDEDGNILSGTYSIYNWIPFGSRIKSSGKVVISVYGYEGSIKGNGHTIYGLYNESDLETMGLIATTYDATITDLTLENCVFNASESAGTFIGEQYTYRVASSLCENLKSVHCLISADLNAGGIIGYVEESITKVNGVEEMTVLKNCISDSYIISQDYAGGIVGCKELGALLQIDECVNLGRVQGNSSVGGILGYAYNWANIVIRSCANAGTLSAQKYCGGIIGFLDNVFLPSDVYTGELNVLSCVSIGKLNLATYTGGIIGAEEIGSKCEVCIMYNTYSQTKYEIGQSDSIESTGTKLSNNTSASYICENIFNGNHISSGHWETTVQSGCGVEGKQVKKCIICGETLEERTIPAHNHQMEYGACNFCGISADSQKTASIFINGDEFIIPMAGIIVVGIAILVIRRKKHINKTKSV